MNPEQVILRASALVSERLLAMRDLPHRRTIVGVALTLFVVWTLYMSLMGFWTAALNCDEGCIDGSRFSGDWTHFRNAWQWPVIGLAGAVNLLGSIAFLISLASRSVRGVGVSIGVHLGGVLLLAVTRATGDGWSPDHDHFLLYFLIGELSALAAATLVLESRRSQSL